MCTVANAEIKYMHYCSSREETFKLVLWTVWEKCFVCVRYVKFELRA
jgi:hypothetical protein